MKKHILISVLSVVVGVFFILSGVGKLINTNGFSDLLLRYGIGGFAYLAPLICVGEVLLGLFMVLLVRTKRCSLISFIVLLVFTIAFAYAHFVNKIEDCGCFGEISFLKSSATVSLIRNSILILFSILIFIFSTKGTDTPKKWKLRVVYFTTLFAMGLGGYTMASPLIINTPFENQAVENTPLANYINPVSDSTYIVFVFNYGCSHCWDATANIKNYVDTKAVDKVIGIAFGSKENREQYYSFLQPNFQIIPASNNLDKNLIDVFPTAFFIKNDTVQEVMQGHQEIVSPYTFKKYFLFPGRQH